MRNVSEELPTGDGETNSVYSKIVCYRCGKQGHSAADCKFKTAKCHVCDKTGHIARACLSRQKAEATSRTPRVRRSRGKDVHQLQEDDSSGGSSAEGHLHTICQLGNTTRSL